MTDVAHPYNALHVTSNGKARGSIFDQALLSFATVVFGSEHHQGQIVERGYLSHEQALKTLNQALSRPDCAQHDEIVLSIVMLGILESIVPTSPGSYVHHLTGLNELLKLRDPLLHITPKSLHIYKSIRHLILFSSLRTCTASVFARPDWKAVLRIGCTEEQLAEQEIWDVLADCSVLQAQCLASSTELGICADQRIATDAMVLLKTLYAWRAQFDDNATHAYRLLPNQRREQVQGLALPAAYEFAKDSTAITITLYNTTLIHVLQLLQTLHGSVGSPDFGPDILDDLDTAVIDAASEVCRCVPHFIGLRPEAIPGCTPIIHWAVSTVWNILRHLNTVEAQWLDNLVRSEKGKFLARGLFSE